MDSFWFFGLTATLQLVLRELDSFLKGVVCNEEIIVISRNYFCNVQLTIGGDFEREFQQCFFLFLMF